MNPQELRHAGIKSHLLQTLGLEKGTEMFARFLKSAANFTSSGFAATPPEILAAREATCRACDQWDAAALNNTGRCRKCGCSTWAKLRMATESCPLGKWKAVEKPESGNLKPESSPASAPQFQVSGLQSQPSSSSSADRLPRRSVSHSEARAI